MANEMRDRLIKSYKKANAEYLDYLESIDQKGLVDTDGKASFIVDRLIKDGVIVPPCKVGNIVWLIEHNAVERATVNKVEITGSSELRITLKKLNLVGKYVYFQLEQKELGKTIFIGENAEDQAEQKLKEMRGGACEESN